MGGINIEQYEESVEIEVLVSFGTTRGTKVQGSFFGKFKRPTQDELTDLLDPENDYSNGELLDKYLESVRGIGKGGNQELDAAEQLAWVKKSPECVAAGAVAFLKAFRPERYDEKTSRRQRSRG